MVWSCSAFISVSGAVVVGVAPLLFTRSWSGTPPSAALEFLVLVDGWGGGRGGGVLWSQSVDACAVGAGGPPNPVAYPRVGLAVVLGVPAALVHPLFGLLVGGLPTAVHVWRSRRDVSADAAFVAELPDVIDLFRARGRRRPHRAPRDRSGSRRQWGYRR